MANLAKSLPPVNSDSSPCFHCLLYPSYCSSCCFCVSGRSPQGRDALAARGEADQNGPKGNALSSSLVILHCSHCRVKLIRLKPLALSDYACSFCGRLCGGAA